MRKINYLSILLGTLAALSVSVGIAYADEARPNLAEIARQKRPEEMQNVRAFNVALGSQSRSNIANMNITTVLFYVSENNTIESIELVDLTNNKITLYAETALSFIANDRGIRATIKAPKETYLPMTITLSHLTGSSANNILTIVPMSPNELSLFWKRHSSVATYND